MNTTTTTNTTKNTLAELHEETSKYLLAQLHAMKTGQIELDTKLISCITKFLKDNHIECTEEDLATDMKALVDEALADQDINIYHVARND